MGQPLAVYLLASFCICRTIPRMNWENWQGFTSGLGTRRTKLLRTLFSQGWLITGSETNQHISLNVNPGLMSTQCLIGGVTIEVSRMFS